MKKMQSSRRSFLVCIETNDTSVQELLIIFLYIWYLELCLFSVPVLEVYLQLSWTQIIILAEIFGCQEIARQGGFLWLQGVMHGFINTPPICVQHPSIAG